jgi:hypothetical protein
MAVVDGGGGTGYKAYFFITPPPKAVGGKNAPWRQGVSWLKGAAALDSN